MFREILREKRKEGQLMSIYSRNKKYVTPNNPGGYHTGKDGNTYDKYGERVSYGPYDAYEHGYRDGQSSCSNDSD